MIANPTFYLDPTAYLDWEAQQTLRHEYVDGEVYAMTGGTIPHSAIAVNLIATLKTYLRGSGCRVLGSDAKVQLSERGPYFYPDVMVSCDSKDHSAIQFIQFPCLIIEVLSPATEAYDRGKKFTHYRQLESLQEYALVSSETANVEIFRLNERMKWELTPYGMGDTIQFTSINFEGAIDLIYEDIQFPKLEVNPDDSSSDKPKG